VELCYFRPPQVCLDLPDIFLAEMEADMTKEFGGSLPEQHNSLLQHMQEKIFQIYLKEYIIHRPSLAWIVNHDEMIFKAYLIVIILLNILILLFYDPLKIREGDEIAVRNPDEQDQSAFHEWSHPQSHALITYLVNGTGDQVWGNNARMVAFYVVGVVNIFLTILRSIRFMALDAPFIMFQQNEADESGVAVDVDAKPQKLSLNGFLKLSHSFRFWYIAVLQPLIEVYTLLQAPMVHCLSLFNIFAKSRTIGLVTEAMEKCVYKMLWLLLLMMCVIYVYAVIGFQFFWNQHGHYQRTCSTIFQCWLTYTNEGMKNVGISEVIRNLAQFDTYPRHIWENGDIFALILLDLSFFIIIVFVLAAFLNGVIVDTFGELRDTQDANAERLENECYICGLTNDVFQSANSDMEKHRALDHNLQWYVFFLMYLQCKPDPHEMVIPGRRTWAVHELNIYRCLKAHDASFFPSGVALEIELQHGKEDRKSEKEQITEILKSLEKIETSFERSSQQPQQNGISQLHEEVLHLGEEMQKLMGQNQELADSTQPKPGSLSQNHSVLPPVRPPTSPPPGSKTPAEPSVLPPVRPPTSPPPGSKTPAK